MYTVRKKKKEANITLRLFGCLSFLRFSHKKLTHSFSRTKKSKLSVFVRTQNVSFTFEPIVPSGMHTYYTAIHYINYPFFMVSFERTSHQPVKHVSHQLCHPQLPRNFFKYSLRKPAKNSSCSLTPTYAYVPNKTAVAYQVRTPFGIKKNTTGRYFCH